MQKKKADSKGGMTNLDLATANRIIEKGMALRKKLKHLPLTFCVVDRAGHMISSMREDDSSTFRFEIAYGKAWTCTALGHSTHFVEKTMTKNRPHFVDSLAAASGGKFIPALGGVLIRDRKSGRIIGALGVTGDSGENDEAVAVEAIEQCGFKADLG